MFSKEALNFNQVYLQRLTLGIDMQCQMILRLDTMSLPEKKNYAEFL